MKPLFFAVLLLCTVNAVGQSFDSLVQKPVATPIYIIDGAQVSPSDALRYPPSNILSVSVYKAPYAMRYFGEKGKNGAVIITSKSGSRKKVQPVTDLDTLLHLPGRTEFY